MIMLRGLKNRRSCTKKKKKKEEKKKTRKWFAYGYGRAGKAEGEWLAYGNGCADDKKIFLGTNVVN